MTATETSAASHAPSPANARYVEMQVADIIWAIATTRTYRARIHERGWTADRYERWLADLLVGAPPDQWLDTTQPRAGTIAN